MKDRNQALPEKALTSIVERLGESVWPGRNRADGRTSPVADADAHTREELNFSRKENSSLDELLRHFGKSCEQCAKSHERIKDERDQIWREIVTQAQLERDHALRRLEIVKRERDGHLERLHALEKENQRLRDEVNDGFSESTSCRPVADFHSRWPLKVRAEFGHFFGNIQFSNMISTSAGDIPW